MARAIALAGLLVFIGPAGFANLFENGDFEQPLEVAWKDSVNSLAGTFRFERSDTFGGGTGYAAKVYKQLARFASLSQAVPVPGPDLTLTFDARLLIGGGSSTCWPVAAFFVRYLDASGQELGATCYWHHDQYADWQESDTFNLIEVTSFDWDHYELNIAAELRESLPGVNPAAVSFIAADLFAYDNGT